MAEVELNQLKGKMTDKQKNQVDLYTDLERAEKMIKLAIKQGDKLMENAWKKERKLLRKREDYHE